MARYAWNDKHPYFALTSNIVHSREALASRRQRSNSSRLRRYGRPAVQPSLAAAVRQHAVPKDGYILTIQRMFFHFCVSSP